MHNERVWPNITDLLYESELCNMVLASNLQCSHIFVLVGNLLQARVIWDGRTDCELNDWLYGATLRRFSYKQGCFAPSKRKVGIIDFEFEKFPIFVALHLSVHLFPNRTSP